MKNIPRRSLLSLYIRKSFAVVAPSLLLMVCQASTPGRGEIFIEAAPVDSGLDSHTGSGKKNEVVPEAIQLNFDESAYYVSPTSSLLYRGDFLTYVRDQGHLRPGSIRVDNRSAPWHGPMLTLPPLEIGRSYGASVWIKLFDTDTPTQVKLMLTRVANGALTNMELTSIVVEPRVWQQISGEFVGSAQTDNDINGLSLEVEDPNIKYLVDDIMVSYAELSAELQAAAMAARFSDRDFIRNGDVEDGLEPWIHQGGVISRSTTHAHTGKHSLLIAGRQQEWNAPMMPVQGLENNKLYRFTIFVRLNDGEAATNTKLTMKRTTAGQTTFVSVGSAVASSSVWTEVSGTFSAPNVAESEYVSVYLEAENPTASYFVDSLTVEEVPTE